MIFLLPLILLPYRGPPFCPATAPLFSPYLPLPLAGMMVVKSYRIQLFFNLHGPLPVISLTGDVPYNFATDHQRLSGPIVPLPSKPKPYWNNSLN